MDEYPANFPQPVYPINLNFNEPAVVRSNSGISRVILPAAQVRRIAFNINTKSLESTNEVVAWLKARQGRQVIITGLPLSDNKVRIITIGSIIQNVDSGVIPVIVEA